MRAYEVAATFVLAGEVATFDREGFRVALLDVFTDAVDATLEVTSASIRVDATLLFPGRADASSAATTITTTPIETMQSAWFAAVGVTITQQPTASVSAVVTTRAAIEGNSRSSQRSSKRDELTAGAIVGIVIGSIISFALIAFAAFLGWRRVSGGKARSLKVEPDEPPTMRVAPMRNRIDAADSYEASAPAPAPEALKTDQPVLPPPLPEPLFFSFTEAELGMELADEPSGGTTVATVVAGGQAAQLGVVEGAVLSMVGVSNVRDLGAAEVRALLATCVTRPLAIEMLADGGMKQPPLGTVDSPLKGVPVWSGAEEKTEEVAAEKLEKKVEAATGGEGAETGGPPAAAPAGATEMASAPADATEGSTTANDAKEDAAPLMALPPRPPNMLPPLAPPERLAPRLPEDNRA